MCLQFSRETCDARCFFYICPFLLPIRSSNGGTVGSMIYRKRPFQVAERSLVRCTPHGSKKLGRLTLRCHKNLSLTHRIVQLYFWRDSLSLRDTFVSMPRQPRHVNLPLGLANVCASCHIVLMVGWLLVVGG